MIFFFLVGDDPFTGSRDNANLFSYFCKNLSIYKDSTLSNSFFALYLWIRALLCCFDCSCWGFISENIISIRLAMAFLLNRFLLYLLLVFIAKHVIIKGELCLYLLLIIIYFCHITHIDKAINLLFLILWPNVSRFWLCFLILLREGSLWFWNWLSIFLCIRWIGW